MNIVENAIKIATKAHENVYRKWANPPVLYITHPKRVMAKLMTMPGTNEDDYAAAAQHDVLEDVAIPFNKVKYYEDLIRQECNETVLRLVWELTNPTHGPEWDGRPRVEKREKDWEHLRSISDRAKRIKLVDRWDNLQDVSLMPKKLLAKYLPESRILLSIARHADEVMADELEKIIEKGEKLLR